MNHRIADVWANYWPATFFDAYPPMRALYDRVGISDRACLPDGQLIAEMDAAGVERALVSATALPAWPHANDDVLKLCADSDGRLVPVASVDPRNGVGAVRELRRAVEGGATALKLLPFLYGLPPSDRAYYPLYATCVELDIPAMILSGHTAVLASNDVGRPQHLDDIALFFPELTIIAGHCGHPWTEELVGLAWKHERLYIDTSGHRPRHFPPALVTFMNSYGSTKVMFGSGFPMISLGTLVEDAIARGLRADALDRFLWGNAAQVWGWT